MKFYFVTIIWLLLLTQLHASHFFGGEMTYECIGNDSFKISMTIYQNCGESNETDHVFDPSSKLHIFDGQNNLVYSQNMPYVDVILDTLQIPVFDTCKLIPSNVCVHYRVRYAYVHLPYKEGGYTASFQNCCLGAEISNIVNPSEVGLNLNIHISQKAIIECNNSPKFSHNSPSFFCLNTAFDFNHSAIDIDGDSISYKLVIPTKGPNHFNPDPPDAPPYFPLDLPLNFNEHNLLGTNSIFQINEYNGLINGVSNNSGLFMIGVSATDYRNGEVLSEVVKTLVYFVDECKKSIISDFEIIELCEPGTIQLVNKSENSSNFYWDAELFDSREKAPSFYFPDTSQVLISLIAEPQNNCADTSSVFYNIELPCGFENLNQLELQVTKEEICVGEKVEVHIPICEKYEYYWSPIPELSSTPTNTPIFSPLETTSYQLEVFNGDTCSWNTDIEIKVLENCNKNIIEVPNVFTPNEDGINDQFGAVSNFNLNHYHISIFSRWGGLIFQSNNINHKWDGTFKGENSPSDVYVWMIEYAIGIGNEQINNTKSGDVTLIR